MGYIKVHAGDFEKNSNASFSGDSFHLYTRDHPFIGEEISAYGLVYLDIANEENVKKLTGTVGWGITGAVLLGPIGLLAGLLVGGRKKEVTFVAKFSDGRKLLATTNSKTYTKITAVKFSIPEFSSPKPIEVFSPSMSETGDRKCPYCAEIIKADAIICRFCGRDVPLSEKEHAERALESQKRRLQARRTELIFELGKKFTTKDGIPAQREQQLETELATIKKQLLDISDT